MAEREAKGGTQEQLCPRRFVRCDDTLARDFLTVGQVYEVLQIKERDGYYVLSSGQFTVARFQPVSPVDAGYG
jgi:hypothetical protein